MGLGRVLFLLLLCSALTDGKLFIVLLPTPFINLSSTLGLINSILGLVGNLSPLHIYNNEYFAGFALDVPPLTITLLRTLSRTLGVELSIVADVSNKVFLPAQGIVMEGAGAYDTVIDGEQIPVGVSRIGAGTSRVKGSSIANVAIVDTGVDLNHADLTFGFNPDGSVWGVNTVTGSSTVSPHDDQGHGTAVAGTIAAKNNGAGVVGVSPGTTIIPVKALDSNGYGQYSDIVAAMDWILAHRVEYNIKVAVFALAGPGTDDGNCGHSNQDPVHVAVCALTQAGITVVAAAGNSGQLFTESIPAAYSETLAVTSMVDTDGTFGGSGTSCGNTNDDTASSTSNYAVDVSQLVHTIAAPGECVTTTFRNNGYGVTSGTSLAAGYVAGAVALCLGQQSSFGNGPCYNKTPAQIINQIRSDASLKSASTIGNYGFQGDPTHPIPGAAGQHTTYAGIFPIVRSRNYGHLVWTGDY